jgi:N-acetylglucosaminyl-diphospho-decaprenol L-rhamnosyltransferase
VTHIGGHATARSSDRMLREHHLSAYRYLADRHQGALWAPFRLLVKAGLTLRVKILTRG